MSVAMTIFMISTTTRMSTVMARTTMKACDADQDNDDNNNEDKFVGSLFNGPNHGRSCSKSSNSSGNRASHNNNHPPG